MKQSIRMECSRSFAVAISVAAVFMTTLSASAAVRYVSTAGLDTNQGTAEAPWRTIQFAVDNASAGDEIRVAAGTYAESIVCPETALGITIKGGYDASWNWDPAHQLTVIDPADEAVDVVTLRSPKVTLSGLTFSGGKNGVVFQPPTAYRPDCVTLLSHCEIVRNANHGVTGRGPRFRMTLDHCLIAENGGDGYRVSHGFFDQEKLEANVLSHCTIANNRGNGVYTGDAGNYLTQALHLLNCIVVCNGQNGFVCGGAALTPHRVLDSCCLWGNGICNVTNDWRYEESWAQTYGYVRPIQVKQGCFSADPFFVGKGDYRLRPGSPCIGAGVDPSDPEETGGGVPCDLGCYPSGLPAAPLHSVVYVDSSSGDDANDGLTPATAKKTINGGLAATAATGACHVAAGTYCEELLLPREGQAVIGAGAVKTIVECPGDSALSFMAPGQTVRGLTLTGAVRGVIVDTDAGRGCRLEECAVTGNKFGVFSGASPSGARDISLHRCSLTDNFREAIRICSAGVAVLQINYRSLSFSAWNCLIARNGGNGIVQASVDVNYLTHCTIADNGENGYVDLNSRCPDTFFTNCIVGGNGGYGISHQGFDAPWPNYCHFKDCCFHGNALGHFRGRMEAYGSDLIEGGVLIADPLFAGDGDYRLRDGSPCLKAGATIVSVDEDLDGNPRGTERSDLGCYESPFAMVPRHADTYVDSSAPDDSADGSTPDSPKKTIQAALAVTAEGGTCHVAPGRYDGEVILSTPGVTLAGDGAETTVIRGLEGFSAVTLAERFLAVRRVTIEGADRGIFLNGIATTNALVEDCVVRSNIFGIATFNEHNLDRHRLYRRSYRLSRCRIEGNEKDGVNHCSGTRVTLSAGNTLVQGNGRNGLTLIGGDSAHPHYVRNCTIADNGGDGYVDGSSYCPDIFFINCIVSGNGGYGIRHQGTAAYWPNYCYLKDCCFHGNGLGHFRDRTEGYGIDLIEGGFLIADPLFAGEGDYRLREGSPCVKVGAVLAQEGYDLDGKARGPERSDLGCYESSFETSFRYPDTYADLDAPDDSADGSTPATAKKTIQAALAVTAEGGTCHVAPGRYDGEVVLSTPDVTLAGAGAATTVIRVPRGCNAVMLAERNLTIRGLRIEGADHGLFLSGIATTNALVEDCVIRSNVFGLATFYDHTVGNHRGYRRSYRLSRCRIEENEKDGVNHCSGTRVTLSAGNTLVQGNGRNGLTLIGGDSAHPHYVVNCTIADNGGDGYVDGSSYCPDIYFVNCIVSGNGGYGIRHQGTAAYWPNYCYLKDCCFHGNGLGHFRDRTEGYGVDLIEGGLLIADPLFAGKGDYHLREGSPCVKVGAVLAQEGHDLDGKARGPGHGDLGCYESSFENSFLYLDTYVDGTAPDDSADGTTPATAKKTIQAALAVTAEGGTCHIASGLYDGEVVLSTPGVTLAGAGAETTVLRVPRGCGAVTLAEGNLTIRGLRIEGGDRGLFFTGISTTNALVEDCVIRSNVFGIATFYDHTSGNHRGYRRSYRLSRCRIEENEKDGVNHHSGTSMGLSAESTLVRGNGGDGMGLWGNYSSRATQVLNCTIADNGGRGIVANNDYTPEIFITNSIVCGNGGAGIERKATIPATYFTHVAYSCVHGNGGGEDFAGGKISLGEGMITGVGPAFKVGTYRLSSVSPCLNAGIDTELVLDLARQPRRANGRTDIGAYEYASLGTMLLLR